MSELDLTNIMSEYRRLSKGNPTTICSMCSIKEGRRPDCKVCQGVENRLKILILTKGILPTIIKEVNNDEA